MTQRASLAGRSTLSGWEQGQRIPRIDAVEQVAYALGVSPGLLAYDVAGECPPVEVLRAEGVGARLRLTRLARGLSVLALAQLADTSHTAIGNIERGGTMPSIATVEALAKALTISPAWLAFGVGPQLLPSRRRPGTRSAAHP